MSERHVALVIFIGLLLAYAFIFPRWLDWNANARFDLSAAIVEQGTLSIDADAQVTQPEDMQRLIALLGRSPAAALAVNRPIDQVSRKELVFATRLDHLVDSELDLQPVSWLVLLSTDLAACPASRPGMWRATGV